MPKILKYKAIEVEIKYNNEKIKNILDKVLCLNTI